MIQYNTSETTKTAETCAEYLKRTQQLFNRYSKVSAKNSAEVSLDGFILWLIELKPTIKADTWKTYKSSVVYFLESKAEIVLAKKLLQITSAGCKKTSKNILLTSSQKRKYITKVEQDKIEKYLKNEKESFWSKPTLAIFKAIIITGMRPIELKTATIIEQGEENPTNLPTPILRIKNAKNTNGRSHGSHRHLGLAEVSSDDLIYLKIALAYTSESSSTGLIGPKGEREDWNSYYKKLRDNFYRVINKLYPNPKKRITFYSCRHQFIANLKATGYQLAEIAAITGHATDETASEHYGKKKNGRRSPGLPAACQEEVGKIIEIYSPHPTKAKNATPKGIE